MLKFSLKILKQSVLLSILLLLSACANDDGILDCFPNAQIDLSVNLNLPQYSALNTANGWAYATGVGAGTRGLILVNTGTRIKAYDRNAPHVCPSENSTLVVEDDITIVLPEDGATWNLLSGEPINSATDGRTPRTYPTQQQGNTLIISN